MSVVTHINPFEDAYTQTEYTIRPYGLEDVEELADHVVRELPKLPNYLNVVPDRRRIEFLLTENYGSDIFMCSLLIHKGQIAGGIAAMISKLVYSWDTSAQDLFMIVLHKHRTIHNAIQLVSAYRDWALEKNATLITASHTSGYRERGMELLLKRTGFKPAGALYHLHTDVTHNKGIE